jgi:ATP-dependent RNA helicase RhlE
VVDGRDLLGCAQTGSGKTAAFALPILQRLSQQPTAVSHQQDRKNGRRHDAKVSRRTLRALILCPTRELAAQIEENVRIYGRNLHLRCAVVFGGVNQYHQVRALQSGIDILIATPGRLQDLMEQGYVDLRAVEVLVLDEADRMLDMGFIPDIRRIVKRLSAQRQTLLFSATMPDDIVHLANSLLRDPVRVDSNRNSSTVETVEQTVYAVPRPNKPALLAHLLKQGGMERTLVFTRTKHGADKVVRHLEQAGIRAAAIHGNKAQNARMRAGSTSMTSRMSSTTTFPISRKRMCTASGARRVQARPASRSPSATIRSGKIFARSSG